MRTYKEPKRIDKPRGREAGIVNPAEYMNRLAASYQQKNNSVSEGNIINEENCGASCPTENDVQTTSSDCVDQNDANGEVETASPVNDTEETVEALDLSSNPKNICPIEPVSDGPKTIEPEENCVDLAEPPNAMESECIPKPVEAVNEIAKNIDPIKPKGGKKKVSPKQKPKQSQKVNKRNAVEVKKKPAKAIKKKINQDQAEVECQKNGLSNDIDESDTKLHQQPPTKKKKTAGKSKKSTARKKQTNSSTDQLSVIVKDEKDTKKETTSDPSLSPRVSKRTPKKNRKYQSDDEQKISPKEEVDSSKKKSNKVIKSDAKGNRKRKLLFEDDEDEDDLANGEVTQVKKPTAKKRKKTVEKETKEEGKQVAKKKATKQVNNKKLNLGNGKKPDLEESDIHENNQNVKIEPSSLPPSKNEPQTQIGEADIKPPECASSEEGLPVPKKQTAKVTKKTKNVGKSKKQKAKMTIDGENSADVNPENSADKNGEIETSAEKSDETNNQNTNTVSPDVNPKIKKKKAAKKQKSKPKSTDQKVSDDTNSTSVVTKGEGEIEVLNKETELKENNESRGEDYEKKIKMEDTIEDKVEEKGSDKSPMKEKEAVKKEQIVITCQHCGHVSHSKSANTRHTRKCVVSIIKGELQSSPARARENTGEGGEQKEGESSTPEEEKRDSIECLLLKEMTLKKVEVPGSSEPLYKCEHCTYGTPKRAMLARHMRTHGIYVCLRCNFICDTHDGLKDHCHQEHKDRTDFKLCRKCSRYVKCTDVSLEKHMEECQGPVPFVCQHCDKQFKYESSLKSHIIRHNPDAPKRFHCQVCSYESNYKANLKKHMTNIHEDKVKNVTCLHEGCKKMFYTEDSMRRHLKWHSEERPFKCPNCEKQFKTMTALRGHKVIHDPARPFKCNIDDCTKDFRSKKHLKNHQEEFHQFAEKKFLCEYEGCTFAFFKKSHLDRHVITHTGERKYGCRICGRAFRHTDNLKIHMRTHTDEKPVTCDLCDFACRQKSSLQYHLRKFHGILPPPKKKGKKKDFLSQPPSSSSSHSVNGAVKKPLLDSSSDIKLLDKKPLSPNRSQNALDLYEFKSDDDLDDETLMMPLWQDKSSLSVSKTYHTDHRISHIDNIDEELPKIERTDSATTIEGGVVEDNKEKENTGKVKKKVVKRKKKVKKEIEVEDEVTGDKDLEEQTLEDAVKQVLQEEQETQPEQPKGRKKKKAAAKSPKADKSPSRSPGKSPGKSPGRATARSPKEAKSPVRSPGKSPGRSPARKENKGKEKGKKAQEIEEDLKPQPPPPPAKKGRKSKKTLKSIKSPKSPVAANKKTSPVNKKKPRKKTKKRKKGEEEEEKNDNIEVEKETIKGSGNQSVKEEEEEEDIENTVENRDTLDQPVVESDKDKKTDEESKLSGDEHENVGNSPAIAQADEPKDEEINTNIPEDESKEIIENVEKENSGEAENRKISDRESEVSSGIDTDFEEELKPPPAPRPPPVVDSDDGDIESGPDDMDTPGRDFESTPPKSVALSDHIHSVPSHTPGGGDMKMDDGSESMPHSNYGMIDSVKPPDSVNDPNKEPEFTESIPVNIPSVEVAQKQSPPTDSVPAPTAVNASADFGGSQSESTMPEVDKDYLGQYLQQFDAAGRSEDEVTRLDTATDRPIDIPPPPQDKDLPPLNLSSSAPPLNLSTSSDNQREDMHSQGSDMSNKRMEILACDRQHEDHFHASREESPTRSTERIPDNVYDSISAMNPSFVPTTRQSENIFPPSSTASSSFMRFTDSDALLQRQRMTTPFLSQSDPNALQNLHRMADSALGTHNNTASSLLRRPTTVPPREDMFSAPTAVTAQTMARNPFNTWAGQEVRPPYWGQAPHLQRAIDRQSNSTPSSLFPKDNYLSRDLMFETSRRTMTERNMFPGLTQSQRPEIPHETFPLERFEFGYFSGHGYPTAPSLDYTRSQCGTAQKSFDERYRQSATGVSDFRALPQTSTSEMFSSINMNSSFNLDKYMYSRDPIYHPQHMGDSTNSPFLPHGVAPQHTMFDREYPPRGFYQNTPYSFVNMNDKQYAAAAASAKLPHPSSSGVTQERDFVPRPNTGAASATDNQIQEAYRSPLLYNMMNRYFE